MTKRKRTGVDPLANAIADGAEIGIAYERMREASEFGLPPGLTLPGYEDADPPLGRYHGQRGRELLSRPPESFRGTRPAHQSDLAVSRMNAVNVDQAIDARLIDDLVQSAHT